MAYNYPKFNPGSSPDVASALTHSLPNLIDILLDVVYVSHYSAMTLLSPLLLLLKENTGILYIHTATPQIGICVNGIILSACSNRTCGSIIRATYSAVSLD